jgi:glutamate synthase domain-containing protein 2
LRLLDAVPLPVAIVLALTLGLAPFLPEPHLVAKLRMLASGELVRPTDIFDLALHGAPWVLLAAKLWMVVRGQTRSR